MHMQIMFDYYEFKIFMMFLWFIMSQSGLVHEFAIFIQDIIKMRWKTIIFAQNSKMCVYYFWNWNYFDFLTLELLIQSHKEITEIEIKPTNE